MNRSVRHALIIVAGLFLVAPGRSPADASAGSSISNIAHGFYDSGEGMVRSVMSNEVTTLVKECALQLTKSADRLSVSLWDTLVYTFEIRNIAGAPLTQIAIRDTLPRMLQVIHAEPSALTADNTVEWQISSLEPNVVRVHRLTCRIVRTAYQEKIVNRAVYSAFGGIRGQSNRVITDWLPWPEAVLEKTANSRQVFTGDTLTYSLRIINTGPMDLSQIQVDDPLPAGLEFLDASAPVKSENRSLGFTIGTLGKNAEILLSFRGIVTANVQGDSLLNTASLHSSEGARAVDRVSVAYGGQGVNLQILKEAADSLYWAGDTLTYDLILSNGGLRTGHSVVVTDTLPGHLEYLLSTHNGHHQNNIVTWNLGSLEPGYHDTLKTEVRIRVPIEDQTRVNNTCWARASQGARDSSHWEITVSSKPDLQLEIQGPDFAFPGDTIQYLLIFSNVGTATAFEPVLKDTLPGFLDYVHAGGEHSYLPDVNAVYWLLPPLGPGKRDTLALDVRIRNEVTAEDSIVNSAWLSYRRASRAAVATCLTETRSPGQTLFAYITVDDHLASPADTLIYTIIYGSMNRDIQDTVHIFNRLPDEVDWLENGILNKPLSKKGSYDALLHELHFTHFGLQKNRPDTIQFKTTVSRNLPPGIKMIENQAKVVAGRDSVCTETDPRTESITRLIKPFIEIKKSVNRKVSEAGDVLTYTVTIHNKSNITPLNTVAIYDLIPPGFRYRQGTARLDSAQISDPDPVGSGDRILLTWNLNESLLPEQTLKLKYRLIVGIGTAPGAYENLVRATGISPDGIRTASEEAGASVLVQQGILDDHGFIFGRVFEDQNTNGLFDRNEPVFKNVELILEDGSRVKSDEYGKYSIPNVEQGQHVLRLNENTLPETVKPAGQDFENLGESGSRLVIVPAGGMAKANFIVEPIE